MRQNTKEHGEKTREAIYKGIISYIERHGYSPTNREIMHMVVRVPGYKFVKEI